jgi:hypothetical protein
MGWYKQSCPNCWDNHDGLTCKEYRTQQARHNAARETNDLLRKQNELIKEQNTLLRRSASKGEP